MRPEERESFQRQIDALREELDDLRRDNASRVWFYGPHPHWGVRRNVLPWLGSDGNNTWCRQTLVVPLFGLGAVIIGLKWHLNSECAET